MTPDVRARDVYRGADVAGGERAGIAHIHDEHVRVAGDLAGVLHVDSSKGEGLFTREGHSCHSAIGELRGLRTAVSW